MDRQLEPALVLGEVGRHDLGGPPALRVGFERQAGEVVHAVRAADGEDGQRCCHAPPGPASPSRTTKPVSGSKPCWRQRPRGAQPCLPGTDDDDIDVDVDIAGPGALTREQRRTEASPSDVLRRHAGRPDRVSAAEGGRAPLRNVVSTLVAGEPGVGRPQGQHPRAADARKVIDPLPTAPRIRPFTPYSHRNVRHVTAGRTIVPVRNRPLRTGRPAARAARRRSEKVLSVLVAMRST